MEQAWKDVVHVQKVSNKERFLLSALVFTEDHLITDAQFWSHTK